LSRKRPICCVASCASFLTYGRVRSGTGARPRLASEPFPAQTSFAHPLTIPCAAPGSRAGSRASLRAV
jgi:hypothetical protein